MDTLIAKLSEIEDEASKILDSAKNKKSLLDEEQQNRIAAYDKEADEKIKKELEALQKDLKASEAEQLSALQQESAAAIKHLSDYYDAHHDELVNKIFECIIRK